MEGTTPNSCYNFTPFLTHEAIKGYSHITSLCSQLILRPAGTIPEEVKHYYLTRELPTNIQGLFSNLTPIEVHALHLRLIGWKNFIKIVRGGRGPELSTFDPVSILRTNYKHYFPTPLFPTINGFRWLRIRLIALILNPANLREVRAEPIEGVLVTRNKMKSSEISRRRILKNMVDFLNKIFLGLERYQSEGSLAMLEATGKRFQLEKGISGFSFTEEFFLPSAYAEITDLMGILDGCFTYPQEILPLLFAYPKVKKNPPEKEYLSLEIVSQLQDFLRVYQLQREDMIEKFKNAKEFPLPLRRNFEKFTRETQELGESFQQEVESYHEALCHSDLFSLSRQLTIFKGLKDGLKAIRQNRDQFLKLLRTEKCAKDLSLFYDGFFHPCDNLLLNVFQSILLDGSNVTSVIEGSIQHFKAITPLKPTDLPSSFFSLFDVIIIEMGRKKESLATLIKKEGIDTEQWEELLGNLQQAIKEIQMYVGLKKYHINDVKLVSLIAKKIEQAKGWIKSFEIWGSSQSPLLKKAIQDYKAVLNECFFLFSTLSIVPKTHYQMNTILPGVRGQSSVPSTTENLLLDSLLKQEYDYIVHCNPEDFIPQEVQNFSLSVQLLAASYVYQMDLWMKALKRTLDENKNRPLNERINAYLAHMSVQPSFHHLDLSFLQDAGALPVLFISFDFNVPAPFRRFHAREALFVPTQKSQRGSRKRRAPSRKSNKKTFVPTKIPLLPPTIPFQIASSVELPLKELIHSTEISSSIESFQTNWLNSSCKERVAILHDLCCMVPQVVYTEVSHSKNSSELLLDQLRTEFLLNCKKNAEDLVILFDALETQTIDSTAWMLKILKMTVVVEQLLKFHLSFVSVEQTPLLLVKDPLVNSVFHQHHPSQFYKLLLDHRSEASPIFPLPAAQEEWLELVNWVIGVTGRYQDSAWDYPSQKVAQLRYLSRVERLDLRSEEIASAREWLCQLLGLSSQENKDSLETLLQRGKEQLLMDCSLFLEEGCEVIKNLLLAVDPEKMTSPIKSIFSGARWPALLDRLYSQSQELTDQKPYSLEDWTECFAKVGTQLALTEKSRLTLFSRMESDDNKLFYYRNQFLTRCKGSLDILQGVISQPSQKGNYSTSLLVLLHEAVLLENCFYALLSLFPLKDNQQPDCHLLMSSFGGKLFYHNHALLKSGNILFSELKKLFPQEVEIISVLLQRVTLLEPVLKSLYRYYNHNESEAQEILDDFRFLDQLRFNLQKGWLEEEGSKKMEEISSRFSLEFTQESLTNTSQALQEHVVLAPCFLTLQHVSTLLGLFPKIIEITMKQRPGHQRSEKEKGS